jgi:hypothetical protein
MVKGSNAVDDFREAQVELVAGDRAVDSSNDGSRSHAAAVAKAAEATAARDAAGARLLEWSLGRPRETSDVVRDVLEAAATYDGEVASARRFRDGTRNQLAHAGRAAEASERALAGLTVLSGPVAGLVADPPAADRLLVGHAELTRALGRPARDGLPMAAPAMVRALETLVAAVRQPEYVGTQPTGRVLEGAAGAEHLLAGWGDPTHRRVLRVDPAASADPASAEAMRVALTLTRARAATPVQRPARSRASQPSRDLSS